MKTKLSTFGLSHLESCSLSSDKDKMYQKELYWKRVYNVTEKEETLRKDQIVIFFCHEDKFSVFSKEQLSAHYWLRDTYMAVMDNWAGLTKVSTRRQWGRGEHKCKVAMRDSGEMGENLHEDSGIRS